MQTVSTICGCPPYHVPLNTLCEFSTLLVLEVIDIRRVHSKSSFLSNHIPRNSASNSGNIIVVQLTFMENCSVRKFFFEIMMNFVFFGKVLSFRVLGCVFRYLCSCCRQCICYIKRGSTHIPWRPPSFFT